jgi:hypothetical protein
MSYEIFCEYLENLKFSKEDIERYTSLTLHDRQPYYEDPGGLILRPLNEYTLYKENLLNEITHIKFRQVPVV